MSRIIYALSLSLSAKYNFGTISQTLKLFLLMFAMLTFSIVDVQGQRIRYGYEWPCDEFPSPQPPETSEVPPPTLCSEVGDLQDVIKIGEGTPYPNSSSMLSNPPNTKNFLVVGDFHFDENYYAYKCIFKALPKITIFIDNGISFTSNNCKFFCCDGMWEGIRVGQESSMNFKAASRIEDAKVAIHFTNEARQVRISESTFNRDEKGVEVTGNVFSKTPLYAPLISFYGNTFSCTSELNKNGRSYEYTLTGFSAGFVQIPTLGTYFPKKPNIFTGKITLGIAAIGSDINVSNCQFIDISTGIKPPKAPNTLGLGIWAQYSNLTFTGLGTNKNTVSGATPTFQNCEEGAIKAETSNLDVKDAYMNFTSYPVLGGTPTLLGVRRVISSTNNSSNQIINIHDNMLNLYINGVGVFVARSNSPTNNISNNQFWINLAKSTAIFDKFKIPASVTCISMAKGYSGTSEKANILDNNIKNFGTSAFITGILVDKGNQYQVKRNIVDRLPFIYKEAFFTSWGIKANGVGNSQFMDNEVNGYENVLIPSTEPTSVGYEFDRLLPANRICGNIAKNNAKGFGYLNNCSGTIFAKNSMFPNTWGLTIGRELNGVSQPSTIGVQWQLLPTVNQYRTNYWKYKGGFTNIGGAAASFDAGDARFSQFLVPDQSVSIDPVSLYNVSKYAFGDILVAIDTSSTKDTLTKNDWFKTDFKGDIQDVGCNGFGEGNKPPYDNWTSDLDQILEGRFYANYPVVKWQEESYLYSILEENTTLISDDIRKKFYESRSATSIPLFNDVAKGKATLFTGNESLVQELQSLRNMESNVWQHYIILGEEIATTKKDEDISNEDRESIAQISTQLSNIQAAIKNADEQIKDEAKKRAEALLNLNASISPKTPYEENTQTINRIWLKAVLQNGYLGEEDLNTIREIASECYQNVGDIRNEALDLLPLCEHDNYPDIRCGTEGEVITKTAKAQTNVVYPNPTSNDLFITLSKESQADFITLSDVNGKLIERVETSNTTQNYYFNVSNLSNGFYVLSIHQRDGSVLANKVSIIH